MFKLQLWYKPGHVFKIFEFITNSVLCIKIITFQKDTLNFQIFYDYFGDTRTQSMFALKAGLCK